MNGLQPAESPLSEDSAAEEEDSTVEDSIMEKREEDSIRADSEVEEDSEDLDSERRIRRKERMEGSEEDLEVGWTFCDYDRELLSAGSSDAPAENSTGGGFGGGGFGGEESSTQEKTTESGGFGGVDSDSMSFIQIFLSGNERSVQVECILRCRLQRLSLYEGCSSCSSR